MHLPRADIAGPRRGEGEAATLTGLVVIGGLLLLGWLGNSCKSTTGQDARDFNIRWEAEQRKQERLDEQLRAVREAEVELRSRGQIK